MNDVSHAEVLLSGLDFMTDRWMNKHPGQNIVGLSQYGRRHKNKHKHRKLYGLAKNREKNRNM